MAAPQIEPLFVSPREAARIVHLGSRIIYAAIKSGDLPARETIAGQHRIFIKLTDLIAWHERITRAIEPSPAQEPAP